MSARAAHKQAEVASRTPEFMAHDLTKPYGWEAAVRRLADHLAPGGWLLAGEPSWLHTVSPHARATMRERGWLERGVTVRGLRRDMRGAGLSEQRRFYGPTHPYERRLKEFGREL